MKAYFISGLGADERAFEKIVLPDGYELVHLPWIANRKNESLQSYSLRMAEGIDTKEPFVLAGLSFGGIVAIEIARIFQPQLLILFSTVENRGELPVLYRLGGWLGLTGIVPLKLMLHLKFILFWFFGTTEEHSKALIRSFIENSDPEHIRWAMKHIANWQNKETFGRVLHIHGDEDKVFPPASICSPILVPKAGHLCVYTHSAEVNALLRDHLAALRNQLSLSH